MNKLEKSIFLTIKFFILLIGLLMFGEIVLQFLPGNIKDYTILQKALVLLIPDIIFLIILITVYFKTLKKDFKSYFKNFLNNFEQSFKYYLIGFVIMVISNLILVVILNNGLATNEENVRKMIGTLPLYMIFSVSIYAPLTEELIFRKSIRDIINNKYVYILISGLIFGFLHISSSISSIIDLLYLIPYSSLGIAFAYTYYKTNNIFSTIMLHSMHNTIAIILYLLGGI